MNTQTTSLVETDAIQDALTMILDEHRQLAGAMVFEQLSAVVPVLEEARHIFLIGAGRSGFMIKAAAMRLMHLGYTVFVVGETTVPAIGNGDLLIAASGSGTTGSIVKAAETAKKNNAKVVCFTTNASSPLGQLANNTIIIPAAGKQELKASVSAQYAGSLFEQGFLFVFDALIHYLWKHEGSTFDELWKRHANLE